MALLSQKYQKKKKKQIKCPNDCNYSWQEVTQIIPTTVPNGIWEHTQNLPKDLFTKHNTLTRYLIWSNNQQTLSMDLQQWGREEKVKKDEGKRQKRKKNRKLKRERKKIIKTREKKYAIRFNFFHCNVTCIMNWRECSVNGSAMQPHSLKSASLQLHSQ